MNSFYRVPILDLEYLIETVTKDNEMTQIVWYYDFMIYIGLSI